MEPRAYSYIRFSTKEQKKGTSYQRQYEDTVKYCEEHEPKLSLDKHLSFSDLGTSAKDGLNREKGELGLFLELVKNDKIPRGSYLIVENLDRLSRENVLVALNQFTSIIKAGITLVTLMDKMEYSEGSVDANWQQLIISITYMAKAYKESKDKSDRGKKTWNIKRKELSEAKKLTSKAPLWLIPERIRISETRYKTTDFKINGQACQAIDRIFRMKLSGMGNIRIEKELNQMNNIWLPPYNKKRKSSGWRASYISKILTNREVIGEFTPCRKVDGLRIPELPIPEYFPHAIDEDLFYKVQNHLTLNSKVRGNSGGKTGKVKNLFQNVVICGFCKRPMHFVDKGPSPKGGTYLHCDSSRRKVKEIGCIAKAIRYDEFEKLFFEHCTTKVQEILSRILPTEDATAVRVKEIEDMVALNYSKILDIQSKIKNLIEHIEKQASPQTREIYELANRKHFLDIEGYKIEIKKLLEEKSLLENQSEGLKSQLNQINGIYDLLNSAQDEKGKIDIRRRLNIEIKRMFEWIRIYPLKEPYRKYKVVEPGVAQIMKSKFIDKVIFKFRGVNDRFESHGIIMQTYSIESGDDEWELLVAEESKNRTLKK